ncbi:MAG TPA: DUF6186 family protein [Actinomycetes bacterium]|nr:DUF6186 family protein [Actinomycetes bacterium]
MSSRGLTIAGYLLVVLAGVGLELFGRRPESRVPPLGAVLREAMRSRPGRIGVIAAWAWIGLHFFTL